MGSCTSDKTYEYYCSGLGDRLIKYAGEYLSYDDLGNPLSYYNGSSYDFAWTNGRRLSAATKGSYSLSFEYNDEGIRTSKTVNGVKHIYHLNGPQIVAEEWGTELLIYLYDAEGSPMGMQYRDASYAEDVFNTYWFEKNLQGDIIAVYNERGIKLAQYTYDAWGNFSTTYYSSTYNGGGKYNPFHYRGYYYDQELGFYYLQSRYYDPAIGRFINADGQLNGDLLGYNQYAYCENNPIMYIDPFGTINWDKVVQGTLLCVAGILTVAAVIATGGTCSPAVAVGYAVLGTAGAAATGVGASEIVEGVTGTNPLEEYLGEETYEVLMAASVTVISFGTMILEYGNAYSVCFAEGTLIAAESGNIPIEEIKEGMLVYAHDPETGETALKPVVQTFRNETTELVHVIVDGEEIICTPMHPFYVPGKGWTAACRLGAGDRLQLLNGEYVIVEQVQHELLDSPVTVYNFEVEGFHTYFVGDTEVLVHNKCGDSNTRGGKLYTNSQSKQLANDLGYSKVNGVSSHGNAIYYNPKAPTNMQYISADVDSQSGGIWKAASSIIYLASKSTRTGTFNWDLTTRIGD